MDKDDILSIAQAFVDESPINRVPEDLALRPDLVGMRLFDHPLVGVADAADPMWDELLWPDVIGPHFRKPMQWLPTAKSVVSFFFPFTERIRKSNVADPDWPSHEWMHGRIEGQTFLFAFAKELIDKIQKAGGQAVAPTASPDFWSRDMPAIVDDAGNSVPGFSSNWSERHVAHISGLGTFGLSAGLITAKGMAGRFVSLVTDLALTPDKRQYEKWDEYCTHCGVCIDRCTFMAITPEGKDHVICGAISARNKSHFAPWYGCGKCQVKVPCEKGIPRSKGKSA